MAETAEFNTTTLIVDDTSNLIEYSAGWTLGFSGDGVSDVDAEYMRTKHGAKTAGLTAKFNFTGNSILWNLFFRSLFTILTALPRYLYSCVWVSRLC